jgi:hypothetical protein
VVVLANRGTDRAGVTKKEFVRLRK